MVGGFTGGSEPASISLSRFRSIAGCCVGTAPVALKLAWDNAIAKENGAWICNIPCDKETDVLLMKSDIPNEGRITLTAKTACQAGFRVYPYMNGMTLFVNGKAVDCTEQNGVVTASLQEGDELLCAFPMETQERKETVRGTQYTVYWRGPDVVDITPRGEHVRLYQRDSEIPKYYPAPEDVVYTGAANYGPTQQKNVAKSEEK